MAVITRSRVEAVLRDAIFATPLTLVQAPLGAGKTTALTTALFGVSGIAWMEAKPWHSKAFVEPLVTAVRTVRPDFGRITLGASASGISATHLGRTFAEELAHIDESLCIIIDDAHVLCAESTFARFMAAVLHDVPGKVHIVLAGRALPDVPLAQLLARGLVSILDASIFAFDATELRALACERDVQLDDNTLRELSAATDGWAAGVTLALDRGGSLVQTIEGPRSIASAYLSEQLLPELPADVVTFLEETSVFETLDIRTLANAVVFSDAPARIAQLQRGGGLVSDAGPGRYRIHPVLRELGLARLESRGAAGSAHARAAQAYAASGETGAALFHIEAANDAPAAAAFLREHAQAAVATGDHDRLRTVASRVDSQGADGAIRWYVDGLLEKARGSKGSRGHFERALQAAEANREIDLGFAALAQMIEHDIGRLRKVDATLLQDLAARAHTLDTKAALTASMLRGWGKAIAYDFAGALHEIEPFLTAGEAAAQFNSGILHAYVQTALGEFDAAERSLDALVTLLENDDRVVLQVLTLIWFARLALSWGHTATASDAAHHAERVASKLELRSEEAALFNALAEVATHNGDVDAAVRYAERARARADHAWYVADIERIRSFADITLARAAFLGHDNSIARELAARAAGTKKVPQTQRAVALTECAVYTLLSDPPSAAPVIQSARAAIREAIPLDAADAVALATADDVLAFLDAANGERHEETLGSCEPFCGLLENRRGLVTLEHAGVAVGNARRGTGSDAAFEAAMDALTRQGPRFEARLARAYASRFLKPSPQKAIAAPQFDLTPRELEILALLVDGLTNKEIAQRLFLSPRTVETHVERVLGKLQVGSRSRAIAMALRVGLVTL